MTYIAVQYLIVEYTMRQIKKNQNTIIIYIYLLTTLIESPGDGKYIVGTYYDGSILTVL